LDHDGQTSRIIKVLHKILSRRHQVDKQRHVAAELVKVLKAEVNTDATSDGEKVKDEVTGATNGCVDADGIFKGVACQDLRDRQLFVHHLDYTITDQVGEAATT
jgi:hypothetical protein